MQTINPAVKLLREAIGKQKIAGNGKVRPLHYVVKDRVADGTLLYNVLTRELLLVGDGELGSEEIVRKLKEQWFLVPDDFDDGKFCREIRRLGLMLGNKGNDGTITGYTIFTTTDCNARCYYCFELGRPRRPMTRQVAEDTARYIIAHAGGKPVDITWFGGEPLYNQPAIDTIAGIMRAEGQEFKSKMISNGYLFTPELVAKARKEWNLSWIQITLDGTQTVYNRSKRFIYKGVNAYARVLDNIGSLIAVGIDVSIRLNVSTKNGDDLLRLVDELHERFGKQKHLSVYAHELYDGSESNMTYDYGQKRRMIADRKAIMRRVGSYGYDTKYTVKKDLKLVACMADNDHSVTVLPDGRLGKCENYSEDHIVGSIYSDGFNQREIQAFKESEALPASCGQCAFFPECNGLRLVLCPSTAPCTPDTQEDNIAYLHEQVLNTYDAWKKWKNARR